MTTSNDQQAEPDAPRDPGISQKSGVTGGDNLQAGGNIIINPPAPDQAEPGRNKLAVWLGIVVALLTIATLTLGLMKWLSENKGSHSRLYGVVLDAEGQGVGGAHIQVFAKEGDSTRIGSGNTRSNGEFDIPIQAKQDVFVWVEVSKAGHTGYRGLCTALENPKLPFR